MGLTTDISYLALEKEASKLIEKTKNRHLDKLL